MYKKVIEYTDYDGNQRKETFYFNFSKAELSEMEMSAVGGFANQIQKIVDEHDNKRIIELFKDIILKSYGEKSADGKHFVKSPELSTAFSQTEAYSELFMELSSNTDSANAFINGIIPQIATLPPSNN
jgi:hypothetical protein